MEIVHGIRNITPDAIATMAMLVSVFYIIYLLLLIAHCHRWSGVFLEMTPFNNVGQPQALTT